VRTGFGTNNVDHCTRLCHASSVAALLEGIGSGAVSNPVMDVTQAEVVIVIGANPTGQPPGRRHLDQERGARGTKLIVMDPRGTEPGPPRHHMPAVQARHRRRDAQRDAATSSSTRAWSTATSSPTAPRASRRCRANVADYSPEAMAPICGIDAETLRDVARLYARAAASMILWGMGVSAARARHRQRALPDRAGADDRPDRPPRHRACIRCAARTTCRARPTPA
jgi:formate dehydrogenase major subunit